MKNPTNKLKSQHNLTSSSIITQSISSRSIFHVGQPAIYIQPKIISDNQCQSQSSLTPNNIIQSGIGSGDYISQHRLAEWNQKNNKQSLFYSNCTHIPIPIQTQTQISYQRYNNWILTIIQYVIFCTFIGGTLWDIKEFVILDIVGNILCGIKIIVLHVWVMFYNLRGQEQLICRQTNYNNSNNSNNSKDKDINNNHKNNTPTNNNKQQNITLYLNKLQLHQLLQIHSIILTPLLFIFLHNPTIFKILFILRLLRLFFPFVINRKSQHKWRACVFVHVMKISIIIGMVIVFIGISMQLLMNNIDNYYCMSVLQLEMFTDSLFPESMVSGCGIGRMCGTGMECRNVYAFVDDHEKYQEISAYLRDGHKQVSFSTNFIFTLLTVFNAGSAIYQKYYQYINQWIIFIICVMIWLVLYILTGIGIGESIRYESLQNWQRMLSKKQSNTHTYTNTYTHSQPQSNTPPQLNKNKQKKRRHSNIAYITSQARLSSPSISDTKNILQISSQFTSQINNIHKQLSNRSIKQKLATIIFNVLCFMQVCLMICDNLNLGEIVNRNIGIALGVIFIVWSFGLAFAVYQHISQNASSQNISQNTSQNTSQNNSHQTYILIYQILAYLLTLSDYITRALNHTLIFQQSSIMTPFSCAAISLRIVYILYNNGFDAYISYYMQKIMENFIKKVEVIGFMVVLAVIGAMVECYGVDGLRQTQRLGIYEQINLINWRISMIFGIASASGSLNNSHPYINNIITLTIKLISIATTIYIAKHINLGYDIIFDIDFTQTSLQLPNNTNTYQQQPSNNINKLQQILINLHTLHYYTKLKISIICIYSLLAIIFQNNDSTIMLILFVIDVFLVIDKCTLIIAYGIKVYMIQDAPVKILYMLTQILLCITYFVDDVPGCVVGPMHVTRVLLLFGYVPQLYAVYVLIKTILLHPKLKIYKIVGLSVPVIVIGMCMTSLYVGAGVGVGVGVGVDNSTQNIQKFINTFAYSISYVYALNSNFITNNPNNTNIQQYITSTICLNLLHITLILFLHIILTFMMVTYFVNRNSTNNGQLYDQILRQYISSEPNFYYHEPVKCYHVYDYLKIVKVIFIGVSFVIIGILSGNWVLYEELRYILAVVNLVVCFVEIFVYLIENLMVKNSCVAWNYGEIILLALSLPGSFFLIVPVTKFSVGLQLNMIVRVCLICSMLRILRIIPLLTNRRIFILSSKILRRISKQLYLWQTCAIFIFICACILPFSMFQANYANTSLQVQFLNFLTGSLFNHSNRNITIGELIMKFIYSILVLFPLRIMLIARVISSFLNNKPNQLSALKDQIGQVISNNGLLDKQQQILFLPSSQLYSFTAQIHKIFQQFGKKNKLKCISYDQIIIKLAKLNIPVYLRQQQDNHIYGIFAFDVIWYLFQLYKVKTMTQDQYLDSLYEKISPKLEKVGRSHFGTTQLSAYLKIKEKIKRKIKIVRQRAIQRPHQ